LTQFEKKEKNIRWDRDIERGEIEEKKGVEIEVYSILLIIITD
jgi:hypothetical protein